MKWKRNAWSKICLTVFCCIFHGIFSDKNQLAEWFYCIKKNIVWLCGVVVITSALHAEGPRFDPGQNHHFCSYIFLRRLTPLASTISRIIHQLFLIIMAFSAQSIQRRTITSQNLMCRGSVHHNTVHKEKSNKMQQCIKILLFHIYLKLNMFRATHHPSSGA